MGVYWRVFSDNFDGQVFTQEAYDVLKTQLGNGNPNHHEAHPVHSIELEVTDKIYNIEDLAEMGYYTDTNEVLTEQGDDEFVDNLEDGFNESDDEGYF